MYCSWRVHPDTADALIAFMDKYGIDKELQQSAQQMHSSVAKRTLPLELNAESQDSKESSHPIQQYASGKNLRILKRQDGHSCLVLEIDCMALALRKQELKKEGWEELQRPVDQPSYCSHITLAVFDKSSAIDKLIEQPVPPKVFQQVRFCSERREKFIANAR